MVKVLVNGGLFEISKVEEIVEKRVPFNGTNIRLVQIAKDSKQAVSGLHFQVKNTECNVFAIGEFTIGNLPTAKVKEIMKQLLSDGYYDFSDCDFQPMMFVEKYKFDEGMLAGVAVHHFADGAHEQEHDETDADVYEDDAGAGQGDGFAGTEKQTGADSAANGDELYMAVRQATRHFIALVEVFKGFQIGR